MTCLAIKQITRLRGCLSKHRGVVYKSIFVPLIHIGVIWVFIRKLKLLKFQTGAKQKVPCNAVIFRNTMFQETTWDCCQSIFCINKKRSNQQFLNVVFLIRIECCNLSQCNFCSVINRWCMTDSALVSALFLGFSERIDSTFWDHLLELNKALRNRIKASEGNSRANISTTGCVNNHT